MIPKTQREENPHYRAMARGQDCQMQVRGVCCNDRSTVVLAHSNWHDKGAARKASDQFGVWACYNCHAWLDQGRASGSVKQDAFYEGLRRMVRQLRLIVSNPAARPRDIEAAQWALDRLSA